MHFAQAHTGHSHSVTSPFELKWSFDPTVILLLFAAFIYGRGFNRLRGKFPVKEWQKSAYFWGIFVSIAAYLPPIDSLADQLFSMHMLQHLLITAVAVPLLILGAPVLVLLRGFPVAIRKKILFPLLQSSRFRFFKKWIGRPLVAAFLYEGIFWFWHIPYFYNRALLNDAIHLLEHGCMALAAINLWRVLIDAPPFKSKVQIPVRFLILGLLTTMDMALSAALTYSNRVWYAYDQLPLPNWWKWDRLQDQQLGGVVMWVPGGFVWVIAMALIFFLWIQTEYSKSEMRRVESVS